MMNTRTRPVAQNSYFNSNGNAPIGHNLNPMLYNQGNFQTAFAPPPNIQTNGYDPKGIFSNHNFINKNDILNNNLQNILLNEEIREYSVMIDSKDRNYQVYPDPFNYEVRFSPLPKTIEYLNGKKIVHEDPAPTISDNFTNVRYIRLASTILPLYTKIRYEEELDKHQEIELIPKVDTNNRLTQNLYVVLSLGDDYADPNYKSTNDVLSDSFAVIYFDHLLSETHYMGLSTNGIKIFPQDQLAKIDKLKISFMDPYGVPLTVDHVDKKIKSNLVCTCSDPTGDEDTNCFKHNLFHPMNPIFQHHIHLKIGVVEPRLGKLNFA